MNVRQLVWLTGRVSLRGFMVSTEYSEASLLIEATRTYVTPSQPKAALNFKLDP